MSRQAIVSASANWLAFVATIAVSFFLMPIVNTALGEARYGVWCIVEAIVAYFTLLDMGLAACLVRYTAKHHAEADRDGLNRMASSCLTVYTAAGLTVLVVGTAVAFGLHARLDAKLGHIGDSSGESLLFMLVLFANLAATLPLSVFPSILDGLDQYVAKSLVRLACLALRTLAMLLALSHGSGLLPLAIVLTVSNVIEHALLAAVCWRKLPGLRFRWSLVDRATLRTVRGYSLDAFLAMVAGRITVQTGTIIVGLFLSLEAVAFFAIALRLVEYAKTLLRTITATLTPGVSALQARGDEAGIARLMLTATRWVLYMVLPVNVGLWLFGEPFLNRWMGPSFGTGSYVSLAILASTLAVSVAQSVAARILYGLGELRTFARLTLWEAGLNLVLCGLGLPLAGIEGVAVAVTLPHLLVCGLVIRLVLHRLTIPPTHYLRTCAAPLLAVLVPTLIWVAWGRVPADWWAMATAIGVGLLPYSCWVAVWEGYRPFSRPQQGRSGLPVVQETTWPSPATAAPLEWLRHVSCSIAASADCVWHGLWHPVRNPTRCGGRPECPVRRDG